MRPNEHEFQDLSSAKKHAINELFEQFMPDEDDEYEPSINSEVAGPTSVMPGN